MIREWTKQKAEEALILLEVQGTEALKAQKQKEGVSLAMLIEEKNRAEAVRAKADVRRLPCGFEETPFYFVVPLAVPLYIAPDALPSV